MPNPESIWLDGRLCRWQDANIHISAHAIHYGSSVFEGIRCYDTPDGPAIFRLTDHIERLFYSASIYRLPMPYSARALSSACEEVIRANRLQAAYLRPIALRGACGFGLAAPKDAPVHVAIIATPWGAYLGEDGLKHGIDACVSSWNRAAPNTFPAGAKAGGQYLNSQLIAEEAKRHGYGEGLALGADGLLSEGSGENLFVVRKGVLYTPPAAASILVGITRDSVFQLAADLGYRVHEQPLPREFLYAADEVFLTGTAAEITPVRSVDGLVIGTGSRGPITAALQQRFFGLFDGSTEDRFGWLHRVAVEVSGPGTRDPGPGKAAGTEASVSAVSVT
jgi:branched-chain amino acid aminotransferase